ncbi:MAG: hypothetical protein JW959_03510 [Pirellulales bacterium]|nr:hypothetical protein [Pirellulales bacterium]
MSKRGRPPVLDKEKRSQILAVIRAGCSRSVAAQYVGCAPSTVQRTAERDPLFAEQLRRAKCGAELSMVNSIRQAAGKERHWRAAAWALERGFPEKYAPRGPNVLTIEQIGPLLSKFSEIVVQELNERERKKVLKRLDALARELGVALEREEENAPT